MFFIEYLSEAVRNRLRQHSQHYRLDHDERAGQIYWMNHCSFCGAQQEDFELYCEPEGAFLPISEHAAASIRLQEVSEPFAAQAAAPYKTIARPPPSVSFPTIAVSVRRMTSSIRSNRTPA